MATVSDRITNIVRVNLDDEIGSRWTDQQLLTFFKQGIRRAQALGHRNKLSFVRAKLDFDLLADSTERLLPSDFLVQQSLWRKDTNQEVDNMSLEDYETEAFTDGLAKYIIDDDYIQFNSGVDYDVPIRLRYYKDALPDALTLSSEMPWGSRIDYPICDYVVLRALTVDRYNTSPDAALLNDMESQIIEMFMYLEPTREDAMGAF